MKETDDKFFAGKTAAMAKYGTWQKWYDANDPEFEAFLGYDKVKFTIGMPDGRIFTERQDIGDGNGGVLDFLAQYDGYREIVPMLREAVQKEADAAGRVYGRNPCGVGCGGGPGLPAVGNGSSVADRRDDCHRRHSRGPDRETPSALQRSDLRREQSSVAETNLQGG